jgi:hypothetical protein
MGQLEGMSSYPAGTRYEDVNGVDQTLDKVIDNSDRKEIVRMIFKYMKPEDEKKLLKEIVDHMTPKEADMAIEDYLYDDRNLAIAQDFIKDNCPDIAE